MDDLEAAYTERHWLYVATQHNLALMYEAAGEHILALHNMRHVLKLRLQVGKSEPNGWLCVHRPRLGVHRPPFG